MRFLRFPVLGAGRNDRAREQLVREETPEEIAAAQAGIDAYWDRTPDASLASAG